MKSEAFMREEQDDVVRCHRALMEWVKDSLDKENASVSTVLFCMEQEIYRLRGVILAHSLAHATEADIKGMYR